MDRTERFGVEPLITIRVAAHRLGIGVRQLRRARDLGQLPVYRIGGWERVRWRDVLAWVGQQRRDFAGHSAGAICNEVGRS